MLRYFIILCITFLHSAYEIADYAMYTFNVGQGNCQLAKYYVKNTDDNTQKIIGFLVDCGSSSMAFDHRFNYEPGHYVKIIENSEPSHGYSSQHYITIDLATHTDSPDTSKQKDKTFKHIAKRLSDIDLLIIMLSHPDQDHINKIKDVVKQSNGNPQIISFLCGNWHQKLKDNPRDVEAAINHLNPISFIFMPYYWSNQNGGNPHFFSGNLTNLLNKAELCCADNIFNDCDDDYNAMQEALWNEIYSDNLNKFASQLDILKNYVNIYSMNTSPTDEGNGCSTIIGFLFKNQSPNRLNHYTEFICTGDSYSGTVEKMQIEHNKKHFGNQNTDNNGIARTISNIKSNLSINDNVIYDVILTTPHHGSKNQNPALQSMIDIFKPHAVIVSAGSGSTYPHPHQKQSELLGDNSNIIKAFRDRHTEFVRRHKQYFQFGLFAFTEKKVLGKSTLNQQYIWSTYYNGSILFNSNGDYYVDGPVILRNAAGAPITKENLKNAENFDTYSESGSEDSQQDNSKTHYTINHIEVTHKSNDDEIVDYFTEGEKQIIHEVDFDFSIRKFVCVGIDEENNEYFCQINKLPPECTVLDLTGCATYGDATTAIQHIDRSIEAMTARGNTVQAVTDTSTANTSPNGAGQSTSSRAHAPQSGRTSPSELRASSSLPLHLRSSLSPPPTRQNYDSDAG